MLKLTRVVLIVSGVLLVLIGAGNIIEEARVMTYDLASILTGIGFLFISRMKS